MNFKSLVVLAFCAIFLGSSAGSLRAQGLFFRLGGGYNLDVGNQSILINSAWLFSDKRHSFPMATSMNFGFRAGYMFTKNLGVDVGVNYHLGMESSTSFEVNLTDVGGNRTGVVDINQTAKVNTLLLSPSFVLTTDAESKIAPYVRAGVLIGIPFTLVQRTDLPAVFTNDDVRTQNSEYETTLRPALGFSAGIGTDIHLGEKLGIFVELTAAAISFRPDKRVTTSYMENGIPQQPAYKELVYVDEYDENKDDSESLQVPGWTPLIYNQIGLNVGLKIRL